MAARQAVLRGLESARGKGVIGHPLDADVQLVLGKNYAHLADKICDDTWETILIVSSCKVTDEIKEAEVVYNDETTGIAIGVTKSNDEKCPRCWKKRHEVAANGICNRCKDVIGE